MHGFAFGVNGRKLSGIFGLEPGVGIRRDGSLDEGFVRLEQPGLHDTPAAPELLGLPALRGHRLAGEIAPDTREEFADFRGDAYLLQPRLEGRVGAVCAYALFAGPLAVVVPVAPPRLRPGSRAGQPGVASGTAQVAPERQRIDELALAPLLKPTELPLDALEDGARDERLVPALDQFLRLIAPGGYANLTGVDGVAQRLPEAVPAAVPEASGAAGQAGCLAADLVERKAAFGAPRLRPE